MTYAAKTLADSVSPDGLRLTTFEVTFPRIVLAEFNTHRMLSRNSASSRAIPVEKMLKMVQENSYIPSSWGKNQKGMQAGEELTQAQQRDCRARWLEARDDMVRNAKALLAAGLHKQLTNRLLEPFMWHTCIVTATDWSNLFNLRNNKDAHPDIQKTTALMQELYEGGEPRPLNYSEWHAPLIQEDEWEYFRYETTVVGSSDKVWDVIRRVSSARCARVSYLTHDGERDMSADLDLHDRLVQPGHMSPLEHVARPMTRDELNYFGAWDVLFEDGSIGRFYDSRDSDRFSPGSVVYTPGSPASPKVVHARWGAYCGNFNGWVQHRKLIPGEYDILGQRRTT